MFFLDLEEDFTNVDNRYYTQIYASLANFALL